MRTSTQNSNYMDKEKIIFYYNKSVEKYNEFCKKDSEDGSYNALMSLSEAGTLLYQAFEAGLKRYLVILKKEAYDNQKLAWKEYILEKEKIERMQRPQLISTFEALRPVFQSIIIDFAIINKNAFKTTNAHKHELSNVSINGYRAALPEVKKFLQSYVDVNAKFKMECIEGRMQYVPSNALFEETEYFREDGHWNYVLITDDLMDLTDIQRRSLTHIKWSMVLDFDPSSDRTGLGAAYFNEHKQQPTPFDVVHPERTDFNRFNPTPYWFYLNGVIDIPSTLVENNNRLWGQKYRSILPSTFTKYHAIFEKPIKVIILSSFIDKVKNIMQALDEIYEDGVQFIILSSPASYADLNSEYNIKPMLLSASEFSDGIQAFGNIFKIESSTFTCMMPSKNGTLIDVNPKLYSHFELVHKNVGEPAGNVDENKSEEIFYQGRVPISWHGTKMGFGVARNEATLEIRRMIHNLNESYGMIHIVHSPGLGGTTFSRMLAYDMRTSYPTCILRQYTKDVTAMQIKSLYISLKTTILIHIDSSVLSLDQVKSFNVELKPMAFPFVIIYTRRKKQDNVQPNEVKLSYMNDYECKEMKTRLEPFATEPSLKVLNEICLSRSKISERSPFFMALYTFEENFAGIESYIRSFLKDMSSEQKNILAYLSIADIYAHKSINENFFPKPLISTGHDSEEDTFFGNDSPFEDLVILEPTASCNTYKLRHHLFADQIIKQYLYEDIDGTSLSREAKANNLILLLIKFIKNSKTNYAVDYDNTLDVMRNLFILKDKSDIIKDKFSQLISSIKGMLPSVQDGENGVGRIFKTLVETYPDDPHFIAHLARFYTLVERNYNEGIRLSKEAINVSESLDKRDPVLYHIYGVNLSRQIKYQYKKLIIECHKNLETKDELALILKVEDIAREALEMFQTTRVLKNQVPGYVSAIELCIDIVDIGKVISDDKDPVQFIQKSQDKWYIKYLDQALSLMDELKSVEDDSELMQSGLQGRLDNLIGDLDKTVMMWESYLKQAKTEEVTQVRRFLARSKQALLNKNGYSNASTKEIDSILKLMEDNIQEDPSNSANIRIWFEMVRYCTSKDSEMLLDEAISNLSIWKATTNSIEAYYYYFILICIKAIDGASRAEADIPFLQNELKDKAKQRYNNREIYEWLGQGKGIGRLRKCTIKQLREDNTIVLEKLSGRIIDHKNQGHAIISSHNMEIFFNPKNAKQYFSSEDKSKKVTFGMGFSYDGLRAYDQSVIESTLVEMDETTTISSVLQIGTRVRCRVVKNIEHFTQVKLIDFHREVGSIRITDLSNGYSPSEMPKVDTILFATIIGVRETSDKLQKMWKLTMTDIEQENLDSMPDWKRQLNGIK